MGVRDLRVKGLGAASEAEYGGTIEEIPRP